jgi:hypothetical protein
MATDSDDAFLDAVSAKYGAKPSTRAQAVVDADPELDAIVAKYAPKPKKPVPAWITQTLAEPDPDEPTATGPARILPEGRYNVRTRSWEPSKPVRAQFTDQGEMTASQLGRIGEDELSRGRAALAAGTLRGLTADFGDEAAGAVAAAKAAVQGESPVKAYRAERDEVRKATRDAEGWDPKAATIGQVAGTAVSAASGIGAPKGAQLLTVGNMGRAAGLGALVATGASEADLTKGELGDAAWDAAKGAGVGAGANFALGSLGAAAGKVKDFVRNAPERIIKKADDALIDAATLGSPASQRDALMGDLGLGRENALAFIKANPQIEKALREGRKADAALMVQSAREGLGAEDAAAMAALDQGGPRVDVTPIVDRLEAKAKKLAGSPSIENQAEAAALQKRIDLVKEQWLPDQPVAFSTAKRQVDAAPLVKKLEAQRDALAGNPAVEAQAEVAKLQKRIDLVKEKWIPEPKPPALKGNELLGKLVEGADVGDKQRAGLNAKEYLRVAKKYKLDKAAHDDAATFAASEAALEEMGKERGKLYGQLGEAAEIPLGNVAAKLSAWRDELQGSMSGRKDASKVDELITSLWEAHGSNGRTTMPAEVLRSEISKMQKGAFAGSYLDPSKASDMGREATARLRSALDEHIAMVDRSMPPDSEIGKKIADLNKRYAPMIAFRDAAEKRAAAAALKPVPAPDVRTGRAPLADAIALANASEDPAVKAAIIEELSKQLGQPLVDPNRGKALPSAIRAMANSTKDPDLRREITGTLYDQVGPEVARRMATLDDRADIMDRLEAPLSHIAAREASPPTTLRSGVRSISQSIRDTGTAGALAVGATTSAAGAPQVGVPIMIGAVAAKYGKATAEAAERAAATMEYAFRKGAQRKDLATIAKLAKLPPALATELVESVAPQTAARAVTKGKDE